MILGSGEYAVSVTDWSGRVVWRPGIGELVSVSWAREKNVTTKANVVGYAPSSVINGLEPWRHLISIYRGDQLVWHGFVVVVSATGRKVSVEAADSSVMMRKRRVASNRSWAQHDATQVLYTMVSDGCGALDVGQLVSGMVTLESRIWVTAAWVAAECMISDVASSLVERGLVWTVVAGRMLIGPIGARRRTAVLDDRYLDGEVTVLKDGRDTVTDALVTGQGVWGQWAVDPEATVGLLQGIERGDGLVRAADCEHQAQLLVKGNSVPARVLSLSNGSRLLPDTPIGIAELIPGVRVPVSTVQTGVRVSSMLELVNVTVTSDEGGEKVAVTLGEVPVSSMSENLPDPADLDLRSPYEKELAKRAFTGTASGARGSEREVGLPPA